MRQMKDSKIEWVGEIPAHWEVMPNKYLMKKQKIICPIYKGQAILSLTMKGVIERDLDAGGKMPSSFDGYQHVFSGNLLLCLFDIDVTPRCAGLILKDGVTSPAYSQYIMMRKAYAPFYSYYYVMVDNTKELLHMAKNLRHSLNEEQFGAIKAPVPPLSEQKVIAGFLDEKCKEVDALIGEIGEEIETLEQYKRSVITEAVTKGLDPSAPMKESGIEWIGEIPEHWEVTKTKYQFQYKKEIAGLQSDKYERLALTMKNVVKRSKEDNAGLQPEKFETYQILRQDELVFKLIDLQNVSTSRVGRSPYVGIVSPAYIILRQHGKVLPCYAEKYFYVLWKNQVFNSLGDDGVRSNLGKDDLLNIPIPVPPLSEQKAIADYLDKKCNEIDEIITDKQSQIETLEAYKKSLIYEYVTGKKEVR